MIARLVLTIIFHIVLVNATPSWLRKQSEQITGGFRGVKKDESEKFFTQKLDHFNRQSNQTFQQRYFVNTTFFNEQKSAPVFLCVGGEGPPLDASVLISSVHCNDMVELANEVGALMLALEHRYYGLSMPFGKSLATENLQWLNTEQALGDIASFIQYITTKFSLTTDNKWVTWGGSYPGMVAGLARLRYPHLIHAAVSSSAPLQPVVDMTGYNDVVSQSMANEDVGGSKACLDAIVEGHQKIGEMLQSADGRRALETQFNVCKAGTLDNPKNQEQFAGDGVVYLPVQSNDPACDTPYCDIKSICVLLSDASKGSPLDRLAQLSKAQQNGVCISANYDAMIQFYSAPNNPERSWLYQTCTEWGFYQTCQVGSQCPYTQGLHTLSVDFDICSKAFGVSSDEVNAQIANTLEIYGGDKIAATRIIFTNGEIDPWRANSVMTSPNDQEPTVFVKGASHHFWTHPSLPTDSAEVNEARQIIWKQVKQWLQE